MHERLKLAKKQNIVFFLAYLTLLLKHTQLESDVTLTSEISGAWPVCPRPYLFIFKIVTFAN